MRPHLLKEHYINIVVRGFEEICNPPCSRLDAAIEKWRLNNKWYEPGVEGDHFYAKVGGRGGIVYLNSFISRPFLSVIHDSILVLVVVILIHSTWDRRSILCVSVCIFIYIYKKLYRKKNVLKCIKSN